MLVNAIGWIVLGLMTGLVASKLVRKRREGLWRDISLGIVGAVTGGWICTAVGATDLMGFNVWSLMVAVVGATALLVAWHLMVGVVGGAVILLAVWDAIGGSTPKVRDSRNNKERI
jgi:uncharacterized membrane protein YeaQ/YmgE (transglycosylase-associated protein family)